MYEAQAEEIDADEVQVHGPGSGHGISWSRDIVRPEWALSTPCLLSIQIPLPKMPYHLFGLDNSLHGW